MDEAPPRRNLADLETAWDRHLGEVFAQGDRRQCLTAIREMHVALRRALHPLALEMCRVALTSLVQAPAMGQTALRRARLNSQALLRAGRLDLGCRALAQEGRLALLVGQAARACELLAAAAELGARSAVDVPPRVWANLLRNLGNAAWQVGNPVQARQSWSRALAVALTDGLDEVAAACHVGLSLCHWAEGDAATGYVHSSRALNWYRAHGRRAEVAQVLCNGSMMLEDFGYWRDVVVLLLEAQDLALNLGDVGLAIDAKVQLVHAYIALGQKRDAGATLAQAAALAACGDVKPSTLAELQLAEGHYLLADRQVDAAVRKFRQARRTVGEASRPMLTHRVMSEVNMAIQSVTGRHTAVREMMEILQAMDRRSSVNPLPRYASVTRAGPTAGALAAPGLDAEDDRNSGSRPSLSFPSFSTRLATDKFRQFATPQPFGEGD